MIDEKDKLVVTVERAGELLGVSRATAYSLAKKGVLPVLRLGPRRLMVPKSALERMLSEVKPTCRP